MAMFAEAVEWATSQTQIETQPPGHIAIDPRERGGRYAVWIRYGANGKQIKDYLGPEGCEKHLAAMAALEGYKRIKEQARNLRKLGFESVEHDAALVIAELSNAGLFSRRRDSDWHACFRLNTQSPRLQGHPLPGHSGR